jgi:hypothetical protein
MERQFGIAQADSAINKKSVILSLSKDQTRPTPAKNWTHPIKTPKPRHPELVEGSAPGDFHPSRSVRRRRGPIIRPLPPQR